MVYTSKKPDLAEMIIEIIEGGSTCDNFNIEYNFGNEVIELRFPSGRWLRVTLEEIENPEPKE